MTAQLKQLLTRPATDKDLDYILPIEQNSFDIPWTIEDFIISLDDKHIKIRVAERNKKVVGYMVYESDKREILLSNIAVAVDYRREGIGTYLIDELLHGLNKKRSCCVAFIREKNLAGQLFFKSCGFISWGMDTSFYTEPAYGMVFRHGWPLPYE